MAGVPGRSGGHNAKTVQQHYREGTVNVTKHSGYKNPKETPGRPEPPIRLTPRELEDWDRMMVHLEEMDILDQVDRYAVASFCQTWVLAQKVKAELDALDTFSYITTQVDAAGNERIDLKVTPLLTKFDQYTTKIERFLKDFGMTPDSRGRVKIPLPEAKEEEDVFKKIQQMQMAGRKAS